MDFLTVRAYVRDAWKIPDAAAENTRLNRAICEVLKRVRSEETSFNRGQMSFTTVAAQATYARANGAGGANLLPYDYRGVLGRDLFNTTNSVERRIEARGLRQVRRLHNSAGPDTGPPRIFASESRTLDFWPTPDGAYSIEGPYLRDLGTPVPRYMDSNATYDVVAAFRYDASEGTYVDLLADLLNPGESALPFPAGSGDGDAFFIGFSAVPSTPLVVVVGDAGVGTYTLTYKYWNGYSFTALSGVTDGTSDFQSAGAATAAFTDPTNWKPTVVDGSNRIYWMKIERDGGTVTTDPTITVVAFTGNDTWEYYLLENSGAERIDADLYSNQWFHEALQVLVHGTAYQYFMTYGQDEVKAAGAQARFSDALQNVKKSEGSFLTPPKVRISLGYPRRI